MHQVTANQTVGQPTHQTHVLTGFLPLLEQVVQFLLLLQFTDLDVQQVELSHLIFAAHFQHSFRLALLLHIMLRFLVDIGLLDEVVIELILHPLGLFLFPAQFPQLLFLILE
jgi:hypothetical protein